MDASGSRLPCNARRTPPYATRAGCHPRHRGGPGGRSFCAAGRAGADRGHEFRAEVLTPDGGLRAVRRFGPTPKVAAVWLSLRELFTGSDADRSHAALSLRGTWDEPIVTPAE